MIRAMVAADHPAIRIRGEALAARMYPELIPDVAKEVELLKELGIQPNYARVVGPIGEPKAALLARVVHNAWATKKCAVVMLWYSDIPGQGLALLRDFRRWVKDHPQIVLAGFSSDWWSGISEHYAVESIARRVGFAPRGGSSLFYFPRGVKV